MGAYSFKQQFAPFVRDGTKSHTIRTKRKNPDRPGSTFYGFMGMRTRNCMKLIEAPVVKLEDIKIYRAQVWITGEELTLTEKDLLAWRDGFRHPWNLDGSSGIMCRGCFELMLEFWVKTHGDNNFSGDVIHWDYARRVQV